MSTTDSAIKRHLLRFGALLGFLAAWTAAPALAAPPGDAGQLIVFLQPGKPLSEHFIRHRLPALRNLASAMGLKLDTVTAHPGAPPDVVLTPLIAYQNHRGRSIYQGRTTTLSRLKNFIRTSRFVPQGSAPYIRKNIPVWSTGRVNVWAPLKIAAVTGTPAPDYRHDVFVREALRALKKGFRRFRFETQIDLKRADRGFYMDFYPWLSPDGTLFLSLALYSQFDCKTPVFELKTKPLQGPWHKRQRLFRQAAALLEKQVALAIQNPTGGDGFEPISRQTPALSWTAIGFTKPAPPPRTASSLPAVTPALPLRWQLTTAGPDEPPLIQFRFVPPLDQYAGEIPHGRGEITFTSNRHTHGARGFVEITPRAVTMGDAVLDEAIQGSLFLNARRFATIRFTIDKIEDSGPALEFGQLLPAALEGTLALKGKQKKLRPAIEFEPILDAAGRPRLLARGRFQLDVREFAIEGAEGPAPARYLMVFDLNLVFRPAALG